MKRIMKNPTQTTNMVIAKSTLIPYSVSTCFRISSNNSSVSGMRSRKQAAIKTPPEKQEQRLMKTSHLLLEPW